MKKSNLTIVFTILALSFVSAGKNNVAAVEKLNAITFKEKIWDYEANPSFLYKDKEKGAIIDFYADWCGPCRLLSPELEAIQADYKEQLTVYKIDTDKNKELAKKFEAYRLPSMLFIPLKGKPTMIVGYRNKRELSKLVQQYIIPSLPPAKK